MAIAAAVLGMVATSAAALAVACAGRRRPLALSALLALAVLVVFEATLLDALSAFRAVTRGPVAAAHALAVAVAAALVARRRGAAAVRAARRRTVASLRALGRPGLLVLPLALLALVSSVSYRPSTWDSMTYHLARVAHWIQNRSVAPYPTHVDRQVLLQPGGEYLLAVLQLHSGSDRLASLVQFAAWLLVVCAAPALARLAGAPRSLAPWAAVLAATLPSGVLQASSTQNDLVAAALALATVAASLPFLHREARWRSSDAIFLGVAVSAAALVKATALVAAAPILLAALVRTAAAAVRAPRRAVVAVTLAATVAALPLVPEVVRRAGPELAGPRREYASRFLYAGAGDLGDRVRNLARGILRHVPAPRAVGEAVGLPAEGWCRPGEALCGMLALRPHEDWAGNPLHLLAFVGAVSIATVRRRRLGGRATFAVAATVAAWLAFHVTFRDNPWIARLELPTYVLGAIASLAALGGGRDGRTARAAAALRAVAVASLALALHVALANETRPPLAGDASVRGWGYYANRNEAKRGQDAALRQARRSGCDRIGAFLGSDGYDYPLLWRAMAEGREVRHVFGGERWPCVIFTDRGPLPEGFRAAGWVATAEPAVWVPAVGHAAAGR